MGASVDVRESNGDVYGCVMRGGRGEMDLPFVRSVSERMNCAQWRSRWPSAMAQMDWRAWQRGWTLSVW